MRLSSDTPGGLGWGRGGREISNGGGEVTPSLSEAQTASPIILRRISSIEAASTAWESHQLQTR